MQNGWYIALRLLLHSPFIVGEIVITFVVNVEEITWTRLPSQFSGRRIRDYLDDSMYRRVQGKLDRIMHLVRENYSVCVIRAFNREEKKSVV